MKRVGAAWPRHPGSFCDPHVCGGKSHKDTDVLPGDFWQRGFQIDTTWFMYTSEMFF